MEWRVTSLNVDASWDRKAGLEYLCCLQMSAIDLWPSKILALGESQTTTEVGEGLTLNYLLTRWQSPAHIEELPRNNCIGTGLQHGFDYICHRGSVDDGSCVHVAKVRELWYPSVVATNLIVTLQSDRPSFCFSLNTDARQLAAKRAVHLVAQSRVINLVIHVDILWKHLRNSVEYRRKRDTTFSAEKPFVSWNLSFLERSICIKS